MLVFWQAILSTHVQLLVTAKLQNGAGKHVKHVGFRSVLQSACLKKVSLSTNGVIFTTWCYADMADARSACLSVMWDL